MSIESFLGFESGEGMSEAAFEAFKEKMKEAAAQIAAIKKEESKHKQKEDELLKILLKYIKSSHNKELVLLISRALEINTPANIILAIIWLSNDEHKEDINEIVKLPGAQNKDSSLTFFQEEKLFSLEDKIKLDNWIKIILNQAEETPEKLIKIAYEIVNDQKGIAKPIVDLFSFILMEYFIENKIEFDPIQLRNFSNLLLKNLVEKTEENFKNRALLN